jgi:hypothetical protein
MQVFFWKVTIMLTVVVARIKGETALWSIDGAKNLGSFMP